MCEKFTCGDCANVLILEISFKCKVTGIKVLQKEFLRSCCGEEGRHIPIHNGLTILSIDRGKVYVKTNADMRLILDKPHYPAKYDDIVVLEEVKEKHG